MAELVYRNTDGRTYTYADQNDLYRAVNETYDSVSGSADYSWFHFSGGDNKIAAIPGSSDGFNFASDGRTYHMASLSSSTFSSYGSDGVSSGKYITHDAERSLIRVMSVGTVASVVTASNSGNVSLFMVDDIYISQSRRQFLDLNTFTWYRDGTTNTDGSGTWTSGISSPNEYLFELFTDQHSTYSTMFTTFFALHHGEVHDQGITTSKSTGSTALMSVTYEAPLVSSRLLNFFTEATISTVTHRHIIMLTDLNIDRTMMEQSFENVVTCSYSSPFYFLGVEKGNSSFNNMYRDIFQSFYTSLGSFNETIGSFNDKYECERTDSVSVESYFTQMPGFYNYLSACPNELIREQYNHTYKWEGQEASAAQTMNSSKTGQSYVYSYGETTSWHEISYANFEKLISKTTNRDTGSYSCICLATSKQKITMHISGNTFTEIVGDRMEGHIYKRSSFCYREVTSVDFLSSTKSRFPRMTTIDSTLNVSHFTQWEYS